jgi:alkylation response protein AidB-like acyl-CoA dehydrogenase
MDFAPNEQQQQILAALERLLERHAGRERAQELAAAGAYDHDLDAALGEAGFNDIAEGEGGALDAALAGFEVARALGVTAFTATALVAPMVLGQAAPGAVALSEDPTKPVRMGGAARLLLVRRGDEALALETTADDWLAVDNNRTGFPMARLREGALERGRSLGPGSGASLRDWWRVELAVQSAALIKGALDLTVGYLRDRKQFGRPIGSFQAVQHRLGRIAIVAEGARWLALEAAHRRARPDLAATAAAYATGAANHVFNECHQLHGAIGFTRDYPLHLWTLRLLQLQPELGGPSRHRRDAAELTFTDPEVLALSVAPAV